MDFKRYTIPAVIPNAGTVTPALDLVGDVQGPPTGQVWAVAGIIMPASWTAADLTFQGSADGATFNDMADENGSEIVVVAAAAKFIIVPTRWFIAPRYLIVRSGTSASPVAQGAARALSLIVRPAL